MTQEEKAKAYDEAKARMNRAFNSNRCTIGFMNEIFPELAESGDERIRKTLIEYFNAYPKDYYGELKKSYILAWLKKQGETFTKKDVEDAYLKGVCDAKQELEKQGGIDNCPLEGSTNTVMTDSKKSQRMISAEAKEALYDKPAPININKMVSDYANNKERGNEEFGKPVNCMIRAYRQGLKDAIGKVVSESAWSEEDEYLLDETIKHLEELIRIDKAKYCACDVQYYQRDIDWLKSLRPQKQWKPSDAQMEVLKALVEDNDQRYFYTTLNSLYEQLKRLKGE